MSFLCPLKNYVTLKIIIKSKFNSNEFLEEKHKNDIFFFFEGNTKMTFRIT